MKYFAFLFLSAFLLINGCNNALTSNKLNQQDFYENNIITEVYFCPQDDCSSIIKNNVDSAHISVHCAFWDLDLMDLIKSIGEKSHKADVKIMIDNRNYDGNIKGPGIKIVKSSRYMHNKFCIIDSNKVITGSMNPTHNGANLNNNNLIIIKSNYIADNYENEFNELWNDVYGKGENVEFNKVNTNYGVIENYFCPEDCTSEYGGGINKIINLIKSAEKSIKVASFSFTHEELADELIKADVRDLDVYVLIERKQRNVQKSQYTRLKDFGINIKVDGNKYNMHHKFVIIDGNIVITGSPNYSFSGNNRNDENMLIIYNENVALRFVNEFDRLFDEGEVI